MANCSIVWPSVNTQFTNMPRLFVDNLTVIDCSILDPEHGLIGASWSVDIELSGELDHQSMVFDFAKVKKTIKRIIDNEVDHKLVVPTEHTHCDINESGSSTHLSFTDNNNETIKHTSPSEAVCLIKTARISRESVIEYLSTIILAELPKNVTKLGISLHNESVTGNYYRYSHGLKKHDGNCQRIAHGHRSQIQIWRNGDRDDQLERGIANKWKDIYLATQEDLVQRKDKHLRFNYTTDQGFFEITLPEHRVHLMDCDSTVECLADHLLEIVQAENPNDQLKVKAFEGIGKGAIACN